MHHAGYCHGGWWLAYLEIRLPELLPAALSGRHD
jgi:hypothetical protein